MRRYVCLINKNLVAFLVCMYGSLFTHAQNNDHVYKDSTAIKFFQRTNGWVASDGGYTVHLSDGSSLWLMGDSHINDYDSATGTLPCLFQVRNAALLQPEKDWNWHNTKTLIGKGPGIKSYFKENKPDKYFSWPGTGVQIKDTIYIYSNSLQNTGTGGAFGFASAGNDYWSKIKFPEMEVVQYTNLPDFDTLNFGTGLIMDEANGYVYAYGQKLQKSDAVFYTGLYVARFRADDPNGSWNFWNGTAWSDDVKTIQPITKQPNVSFHVASIQNKPVLTSCALSVGCDMGKEIYTAVGESFTGPFSDPKLIYTIDDTLQGHYPFFYLGATHPEFINDKNEILITYSINGYDKCVEGCINGRMNPDHYRLKAIRVPLGMIDKRWTKK